MTAEAWFVAAVVLAVLLSLWKEIASPSVITFTGVVVLLVGGSIDSQQAFSGFSNPAPITVGALFVVASAVSKTGAIDSLTGYLLGNTGNTRRPMLRLLTPTIAVSGFVNNIPLVAMLMPRVTGWAKSRGLAVSTFLMPLSFGAILGGMLTVIGTSTNLVVSGKMSDSGLEPMSFFETGIVGFPIAIGGLLLIVVLAPRALSSRKSSGSEFDEELRHYTIEMTVTPNGPVDGKTVVEAGLRALSGVFLVSIDRGDTTIAPATPSTVLRGGNTLRFAGRIEQVLDLQRIPGLSLTDGHHVSGLPHPTAEYFTVVIGSDSPVVGRTLKEVGFRAKYQAAVIAIHRADHRIDEKLGDVSIRIGDALVVVADPAFRSRWQNRSDFLIVAPMDDSEPPRAPGAKRTLAILLAMIVFAALDIIPILQGSLIAALLLIVVGILTADEARRAVDLEVIGVIASAFGLAAAVESSGLAATVSRELVDLFGGIGPRGVLLGVVVATVLVTELITNNAAALLMFPIAVAAAPAASLDPRGMAIGVAIAASTSFLTPIGYQTNTMVYGPGGYRFSDYIRLGLPLTTVVVLVLVAMVPVVYGI